MIIAIIQARVGSTRFPRKIFAKLANKPLIWHVVNRLKFSKLVDKIVLATTTNQLDDELVALAEDIGVEVYRGEEDDVLSRFYYAAKQYSAKIIVRITADDPFKDPVIIDKVIHKFIEEGLDFTYNNCPPTFPEGLDVEVFSFNALEQAFLNSEDDFEKEHVTQFFYRNKALFKQGNLSNSINLSSFRWTIDTDQDYKMCKIIYDHLYIDGEIFNTNDILNLLKLHPEISEINKSVERSEMYKNEN